MFHASLGFYNTAIAAAVDNNGNFLKQASKSGRKEGLPVNGKRGGS
jgi:hypothetical protein